MHPRNRHQDRYDLKALCQAFPPLAGAIITTKYGEASIDFANAHSVKLLNQAILKSHYQIDWDIPSEFLCPPIPGRADYIHHLADLIHGQKTGFKVLDIGVGANCIYPLIGVSEYQWSFVGSDINPQALKAAQNILDKNPKFKGQIELRLQTEKKIFHHVIKAGEHFDLTMCNPPFHASAAEALEGTTRKWKNLGKSNKDQKNFGGVSSELWTSGGERAFIKQMIEESENFAQNCTWFTTLVSKEENLNWLLKMISKTKAQKTKVLEMSQGQKKSRILCWSFRT